jgi:hypothetical protein
MNYLFTLLLIVCSFTFANGQNTKYEKWVQPGFFRGYNVLYESPKTLQDFIDFKNYGGNLFQIGTDGFMAEDPPYGIIQANIDGTDLLVNFCRQAGIYYTIAVRTGPGAYDTYDETQGYTGESRIWNSGNFTEQQLYANMLVMMVERYAGDSLFAGLNLVVEPRPKVRYIPANTSSMYKFWLENVYNIYMNEVYQFFINELRGADAQLPLILENFAYSTAELFPAYEVTDPYIIYDAHLYMPKEYTNADKPYSLTYPGTYWNITYLSQQYYDAAFMRETVLSRVREFQLTTNTPTLLGEFGIFLPQIGTRDYISDVLTICKDYGWHFAFWDWRRGSGMNWNIEKFYAPITPETWDRDPWRTVLSFFYPPPVPVLKEPADSAFVSGTPVFSWQALMLPTRFDIQVHDGVTELGSEADIFDSAWTYNGATLVEGVPYYWRVKSKNPGGARSNASAWSEERVFFIQGSTKPKPILTEFPAMKRFRLHGNYPNPFNPVTNIAYETASEGTVSLKVYSTLGEEVGVLVNEHKEAGRYSIQFNASNLPSGVYFYQLRVTVPDGRQANYELGTDYVETRKMLLVK